jgi:hypothetical protein
LGDSEEPEERARQWGIVGEFMRKVRIESSLKFWLDFAGDYPVVLCAQFGNRWHRMNPTTT